MNFPDEVLYNSSHEWVKINGNEAVIGISDYAQSELGDIIFVELPAVGKKIQAGQPFGSIEAVKTVSDLYAPLSGEITAINETLQNAPETINTDAYGEGWIIKMKITDAANKNNLLSAQKYRESIAQS